MVPVEFRKSRVPERQWPDGERWCSGCQSFVPLQDVPKGSSRCKPCASSASHGAMIEKTYGLTAEGYAELLKAQGGKCAICRNKPGKKRLAVDHDHKTGAVRGLLCGRCNHELLGAGFDSPLVLLSAWHYLNTPPATGAWIKPEDGLAAPDTTKVIPEAPEDAILDPVERKPKSSKPDRPLPPNVSRATCDDPRHLVALGSASDERGFYRLYAEAGDERPPF